MCLFLLKVKVVKDLEKMHLCNLTQTMHLIAITDAEQCSVARYSIQYIGGYLQGYLH